MSKILSFSLVVLLVASPALAVRFVPNFDISCEGTESTGGGASQYQYEVRNVTAAPITVTDLWVATDDLNLANYTNIVAPGGFGFILNPGDTSLWTTTVKTAHGALVPNEEWVRTTAGTVRWNNPAGLGLATGFSFTFGFDNPNRSQDDECVA